MKLDPDTVELEEGFTRDTRGIGHYGTGELEVSIKTAENFQKAKKLIERAYQETLTGCGGKVAFWYKKCSKLRNMKQVMVVCVVL